MADIVILDLDDLNADIPALTDDLAQHMRAAVVMCMEPHKHSPGIFCALKNLDETLADLRIQWKMSYSERIRRAFGDSRNAAELAGEAIAILTVLAFTDYTVFQRAGIGSGFDFWLSQSVDDDEYPFQHNMGLESKGLSHARYPSQIITAVRKGLSQISKSKFSGLPALVVATEFSRPVIYMVQYEP